MHVQSSALCSQAVHYADSKETHIHEHTVHSRQKEEKEESSCCDRRSSKVKKHKLWSCIQGQTAA